MKSVAWLDTFHTILGVCAVYIVVIYLVTKYFPNGGLVEAATAVASNPETAKTLEYTRTKRSLYMEGEF